MWLAGYRKLLKPGGIAGFVSDYRSHVVIRMSGLPVRQNDRSRPCFSDPCGDSESVFNRRREPRIAETHAFTEPGADDFSGSFCLLGAKLRRAPCSHFALSEVQNAHRIALRDHPDQ